MTATVLPVASATRAASVALATSVVSADQGWHAAPAASCLPDPAEQEARADAIAEVEVLDVTLDSTASQVRVGVRHVLEGTLPAELVLEASLPDEGSAGEVPFAEGWPHRLLFLNETTPGSGRWYTSLCDGSRPIPAP